MVLTGGPGVEVYFGTNDQAVFGRGVDHSFDRCMLLADFHSWGFASNTYATACIPMLLSIYQDFTRILFGFYLDWDVPRIMLGFCYDSSRIVLGSNRYVTSMLLDFRRSLV